MKTKLGKYRILLVAGFLLLFAFSIADVSAKDGSKNSKSKSKGKMSVGYPSEGFSPSGESLTADGSGESSDGESVEAVYSDSDNTFSYEKDGQSKTLCASDVLDGGLIRYLGIEDKDSVGLKFAQAEDGQEVSGIVVYDSQGNKIKEYDAASRLIVNFYTEGVSKGKVSFVEQETGGLFRWADNNSLDPDHLDQIQHSGLHGEQDRQFTSHFISQKYFYNEEGLLSQIEYYTSTGGVGNELGGKKVTGRYTYRIDKFDEQGIKTQTQYYNDPYPTSWDPELQGVIVSDDYGRYFLQAQDGTKWLIIARQEGADSGEEFLNSLMLGMLAEQATPVRFSGHEYSNDVIYFDYDKTKILAVTKGQADEGVWIDFEAGYLLSLQFMQTGDPAYGAINNVSGEPTWVVPRENAMAMLGLLQAWESTGNSVYLDSAKLVAQYLTRVQDNDGAWFNQYTYADPGDTTNPANEEALAKSPTQTAEVMIALYKLGYDAEFYEAMIKGAEYLLACADPDNKGGIDDGLVGAGKDSQGNFRSWRWASDNSYAYQALKAAAGWARGKGDDELALSFEESAAQIIQGIDNYLYIQDESRSDYGVWYRTIDQNGNPVDSEFHDWINYAPAMLDLPVLGADSLRVGEWIHQTFQKDDGSVVWNDAEDSDRKSPGFSFQAILVWEDSGQDEYVQAALSWVKESGLWQTVPDQNSYTGGWIDWAEDSSSAPFWQRFIDTSFYFISALKEGYDFSCGGPFTPPAQEDSSYNLVDFIEPGTETGYLIVTNNANIQQVEIVPDQDNPLSRAVEWQWQRVNSQGMSWSRVFDEVDLSGEDLSELVLSFIASGEPGSEFSVILGDNKGNTIEVYATNQIAVQKDLQIYSFSLDQAAVDNPGFDWAGLNQIDFVPRSDTGDITLQQIHIDNLQSVRDRGIGVAVFNDNEFTPIDDWYGIKPAVVMSFKDLLDIVTDDIAAELSQVRDNGQIPYLTLEFWEMELKDQEDKDAFISHYGQELYDRLMNETEGKTILESIAQGTYDQIIRDYAQAIAETDSPVLVRLFHEFNAHWYPFSLAKSSEEDFIAAWEKVYTIFQEESADNALFVLSPYSLNESGYDKVERILAELKGKVDIVAVDGYGPSFENPEGPSFNALFTELLTRLQGFNLPFMIGEFGAEENKEDFYTAMDNVLRQGVYSNLIAVTYFDIAKYERGRWRDFGVSTIPDVMQDMHSDSFYKVSPEDFLDSVTFFDEKTHLYWKGNLEDTDIDIALLSGDLLSVKVAENILTVIKDSQSGTDTYTLDLVQGDIAFNDQTISLLTSPEEYLDYLTSMSEIVNTALLQAGESDYESIFSVDNYLKAAVYRLENIDYSLLIMPVLPDVVHTASNGNLNVDFVSGVLRRSDLSDLWAEVVYDDKTEYWDLHPDMLSSDGENFNMRFDPAFDGKQVRMRLYGFDTEGRQTLLTNQMIVIVHSAASGVEMPVLPETVQTDPDGSLLINFVSGELKPDDLIDLWAQVEYDGKTEYWDFDPSMLSADGNSFFMVFESRFSGKTIKMSLYGFDNFNQQTGFTNQVSIYVQ